MNAEMRVLNDSCYLPCMDILIVEDDELYASHLEMLVDQLGHTLTGMADHSDAALELVRTQRVDLILMDVNIKGQYDGIELTGLILAEREIPIIYITANHDDLTFQRALRSNPAGFILKPFDELQLKRAIQLALSRDSGEKGHDLEWKENAWFIKRNKSIHRVEVADVHYLQADGRYCLIHIADDKFLVRKPLKDLFAQLPEGQFTSTHRSYVVNLRKVSSVDLENDTVVVGPYRVPFSTRERERILGLLDVM